ncbi:MAG: plastocyanin/azurin family copper-binding protein [Thalassobaculum sp.]|uniref:cupredoxin domain-containing protein n=1 Tax=Thalassobaculum sp. TaxID=2022740 RepID=UPI0032EF6112
MRHPIRTVSAAAVAGTALGTLVAVAAFAAESRVVQTGKAFEPKALTVKAGDSVVFANEDFYDHNVYSESDGNVFNLGIQPPGQTNAVTLANAGTVQVLCRIHPKMKLVITVE